MAESCLIIVESPGKIKSIQKYLDMISANTYTVMSSSGHICDLPEKDLGFDPKTFVPTYEVYEDKLHHVKKLKAAAAKYSKVILATDADREGEAIAYHLQRILGLKSPDRIEFGSIELPVLREALKNPRKVNQLMVDSQETRRILDRMIGWLVSPIARDYVVPKSSMGRVQTAVLWMLVDLERRIKNFQSVQHYGVEAYLLNKESSPAVPWTAVWDSSGWLKSGETYWLDRASAQKVSEIRRLKVVSMVKGNTEIKPHAPFITSTLQRTAQKVLKLTPKETMSLAQKLYEAGAITYMRTDSPNISAEAFIALKKYAIDNDLPVEDTQRRFKSKTGAQEAHEAIRPTSFLLKEVGQGKIQDLYNLIWMRALACQLKAAKYDTKEATLEGEVLVQVDGLTQNKKAIFKARGRTRTYKGWMQLSDMDYSEIEDDEKEEEANNPIPDNIREGDILEVSNAQVLDKKTAPPNRLTSSALIARLETSGIGRPSTYASTVELLEVRDYIEYVKGRIFVTDRGIKIIDTMERHFKFIDVAYTAEMESALDDIANGKPYFPILKSNWDQINGEAQAFIAHIHSTLPQHKCEVCHALVIKKTFKDSAYWACTSCSAKYADGMNKPSVRQIRELTEFKCEECGRQLIFSKGVYQGEQYASFSCSGKEDQDALNRCYARYDVLSKSNPETPDFEKYRKQAQFKCRVCDRQLLYRSSKGKDKKVRTYWVCSGYRKEAPLCSSFYDDNKGEPDYQAFEMNHKFNCASCSGYLTRYKYKEKSGHFWVCRNKSQSTGEQCGIFYEDLNEQPDYDKYQRDHEYKCINCNSFLAMKTNSDHEKIWRCQSVNNACGFQYADDGDRPDLELAKKTYTEKCPNCKLGFLSQRTNSKGLYWSCSNWDCKTFFPDEDGKPDLEYKPEKK